MTSYIPVKTGDYEVGTTCFSFFDKSQDEVIGNKEGNRRISIRMYYPTDKASVMDMKKSFIFSEAKKTALKKSYFITVKDEENTADYYYDAPISVKEKFPLILFNHGMGAYIEANTYLCIELASHGYIIASIGHNYDALETDFDDGSYTFMDKKQKLFVQPIITSMKQLKLSKMNGTDEEKANAFDEFQRKHAPYVMDRINVWYKDTLSSLEKIKEKYSSYIDFTNGIGADGHSFGGDLAYKLCHDCDDISCGINLDGALFGDYQGKIMKKPFFQITNQTNKSMETRSLINSKSDVYLAVYQKTAHLSYTDVKFYANISSMVGKIDSKFLFETLSSLNLKFFDKYLKNREINDLCQVSDLLVVSQIQ